MKEDGGREDNGEGGGGMEEEEGRGRGGSVVGWVREENEEPKMVGRGQREYH